MRRWQRTASFVLAMGPLCGVAAAGAAEPVKDVRVANTASEAVPTSLQADDLTHLRRKPIDHVHLRTVGNASGGTFTRWYPEGIPEAGWTVPPGKVFVLTDVDWVQDVSGLSSGAGALVVRVVGTWFPHEHRFHIRWDGSLPPIVVGEHHLTAGVVIPTGASLATHPQQNINTANLYGYLASSQ